VDSADGAGEISRRTFLAQIIGACVAFLAALLGIPAVGAAVGDRKGPLSWLVSANYLDSYQQPLTYTTFGATPANPAGIPVGTTGTSPALNKQGVITNVVGTGALAHSQQRSGNLRLAYDVSPLGPATYSFGIWNNVQTSNPQTYLTSTASGGTLTRTMATG